MLVELAMAFAFALTAGLQDIQYHLKDMPQRLRTGYLGKLLLVVKGSLNYTPIQ